MVDAAVLLDDTRVSGTLKQMMTVWTVATIAFSIGEGSDALIPVVSETLRGAACSETDPEDPPSFLPSGLCLKTTRDELEDFSSVFECKNVVLEGNWLPKVDFQRSGVKEVQAKWSERCERFGRRWRSSLRLNLWEASDLVRSNCFFYFDSDFDAPADLTTFMHS